MNLYHATTRTRLVSIRKQGLLLSQANPQSRLQGIWLHSASQRAWAVVHTQHKYHVTLEEVIVVAVQVPRRLLTRFRRGLWYTTQDVSPARLGDATPGATFGASAQQGE